MEDPYCDVEVERNDGEQGSSTSGGTLPYMSTFSGKHAGPGSVTMFYPQLTGYDIHPLLINQRRRSAQNEKLLDQQDPLEETQALNPDINNHQLKDVRYKQKLKTATKRRPNELQDESYVLPENPTGLETEASDYSAKNRKSFYCRACGKAFKFQTSLLRHNNKVHISKYQCPTCSRVFSRQAYLDVHTSKQGSSCFLDPALRMPRGRPQLQPLAATTE
ncbi:hypothetical protein RUM44_010317 [Polyplax serrata]|uniref:C2H2-type domain-containing protein n=1 Tax=Polyplax serrata TaxID=468196 RepID=A0ABR1AV72_POLSC